MAGVDQIDALIIAVAALGLIQGIETMEDDVAGPGLQSGLVQQGLQSHPGPFSDRGPALDAVVLGDLGLRRPGPKVAQRQAERPFHQTVDDQTIVGKPAVA